jgi:excinuclease ABC subunit C
MKTDSGKERLRSQVRQQLKHIPSLPGAYVFRDAGGKVLYVGKARDLKKRVRQYFTGSQQHRTALFVGLIDTVETIIAGSEKEALLLESTLIKRYKPHFNVDLKDDKSYPFFRVTVAEEYPRLEVTRKIVNDGSLYFGPFADAGGARRTADWLERAFPLRRCRKREPGGRGRPGRPCIDYQMDRCLGPCSDDAVKDEYSLYVKELVSFLKGGGQRVIRDLTRRMEEASGDLRFEEAALIRDRIRAMKTVLEKQDVVASEGDDLDVIGYDAGEGFFALTCLFVRSGMLVGKTDKVLRGKPEPSEAVEAFLTSHYKREITAPPRIFIPVGIDFDEAYGELLTEGAGRKVSISSPARGRGARLLALAKENARQALGETVGSDRDSESLSEELGKILQLPFPVRRIECVDISHTSGRETRGSTVAWERGRLIKDHYRIYSVKGQNAGDDYGALQEVITRRFTGTGSTQMPGPDLLLIDGGKGQLSRAHEIIRTLPDEHPALASISKAESAKKEGGPSAADEIYIPGRANPLKIPRHSQAFHILQMLRDEAHRFALSSHRRRRGKDDLLSRLDGIKGIGPVRRKLLLGSFRSVDEIMAAPVDEIAALKGFNRTIARRIKEDLK